MVYGKIILMGEHVVLYGYPAIAIPFLGRGVEVKISHYEGIYIKSQLFEGYLEDSLEALNGIYYMIKALQKHYLIVRNVLIEIISDLMPRRGMGSSAAVSYAILKQLNQYFGLNMDDIEQKSWVNLAENHFHQKASGIDLNVVMSNKLVYFQDGVVKKLDIELKGYLCVLDTGIESKTKDAVMLVKENIQNKDMKAALDKLGELCEQFITFMKQNDHQSVKKVMNQAQQYLNILGVSHPFINVLCDEGIKHGLGCKLTGGGQGGLVIFYSDAIEDFACLDRFDLPKYIIRLEDLN